MNNLKFNYTDIESELDIKFTKKEIQWWESRNLEKYVLPNSNYQISAILTKFNKPRFYYRLCLLFSKFTHSYKFADVFYFLFKNKNASDMEIYSNLFKEYIKTSHSKSNKNKSNENKLNNNYSKEHIAEYLYDELNKAIDIKKLKIKTYLDIGCGNCILTRDIGKFLKLLPENIYGADIETTFEESWKDDRPNDINFVTIRNNKLVFDTKFDIVSCIMVLHHVPKDILLDYIKQIYNLLNPNGLFLIKEHDCHYAIDSIIADIEHSLYIYQNSFSDDNLKNKIFEQENHFYNKYEWQYMFSKVGFKLIYTTPHDISLNQNYAPSRGYIAIYKKIK